MNLKAVSRNVGYALLTSAFFMFLSILVSMSGGNDSALAALVISFIITFVVGVFPFIFVRKTSAITLKDGFLIVVLSWLLSFVFGMLPYALWGGPFTVINAWFESVSGFTTTGATILEDIEALPGSLLFWRSSTHFIGGLGVVVFLLLVIPNASPVRMRLTNMELSSLSKEGYRSRANKTVFIFAYVYLGICVFAFFAYLAAGMTPLDAICHAFSVCATGGFSTKNLSIGAFDSRAIEGITMLCMYMSSIHFGLVFMAFANMSLKPLNNPVIKVYTSSLVFVTVVLAIILKTNGNVLSWGSAIWDSAFTTLSISTTSGFGTIDNSTWPPAACLLFICCAIMCACAGSTSGGVKVDRVIMFFKCLRLRIRKNLYPSIVEDVRINGNIVHDDEVHPHTLYLSLFLLIVFISTMLCLLVGVEPVNAFAASVTSMGNVGPALGDMGLLGNFNSVPAAGKIIYTLDMFLGRVEIYPIFVAIAMIFSHNRTR